MKVHSNGRANRLTASRWRCDCKWYNRKWSGCSKRKVCNPHMCTEYKEKYPKKQIKTKTQLPWINQDEH